MLASAVVQVTCKAPAFFVLSKHQSSGKVTKLIGLLKDLSVSPAQLLSSKLHLSIERISEGAKTLFAIMQFTLDALTPGDVTRYFRSTDDFSCGVSDRGN